MAEASVICSSTGQLSPEEERLFIRDITLAAESNIKEGDCFYIITQRWWHHWVEYVNQDQAKIKNGGFIMLEHGDAAGSSIRPGSIDNSELVFDAMVEDCNGSIEIQDTLLEGRDYVLLPEQVWNLLYSWYGGGPVLARKVISSGFSQTELAVEVYPLRLRLLVMPKGDRSTIRISKKETVGGLHRRACEIFDLNIEQVSIWDYYGQQKHALMNDVDKTLDDSNIQMDQEVLVEILNHVDGLARSDFKSCNLDLGQGQLVASIGTALDSSHGAGGISTRGYSGGLIGLINLGNTCFMNSAIQCLVHTPEFAKYFREDYHQEINRQNPLGMVGELAVAFGDLLRKLWTPGRASIPPRSFKAKLARFAPQFGGYSQHDSQELLAFLLDGLHEDLNRVKDKPYIKSRDADGRPDEDVADEYWANHIARNDSIIVDVCQGQFKSTLICPVCRKISVTFDPFMYISLPLQLTNTRSMTVMICSCDGTTIPFACTVTVPKIGRCRDLINALGSASSLKKNEQIKLVEIRDHVIQKFLDDPLIHLATIKDYDRLAAYKIPKSVKKTFFVNLIHCRQECETDGDDQTCWKPFGIPLLSTTPYDIMLMHGDIRKIVLSMLSPLLGDECFRHSEVAVRNISKEAHANTSSLSDINSISVMLLKLHLQLVDENNASVLQSEEDEDEDDESIKLSPLLVTMVVHVNWSKKLLEKYDSCSLDNLPEVLRCGHANKKIRMEPLSLYTCLEAFLHEEPLVPEDMWYCPQCKERRQASKKLDLWRLPEVLVIHLKRFSYSRSVKHKLETFVDFPIHDFDLTNYMANKNSSLRHLYELYALTNHFGGMGSGHYIAHIKLLEENRWYSFDDSHISPISEDDIKSAAAYVLFYRRVTAS